MEDKKKVILVKGDNSKWFEQAIFIINPNTTPGNMPVDLVKEAEKIINSYLIKKNSYSYKNYPPKTSIMEKKIKSNKNINSILNISIVLCCILIGLILYYFTK